MLKVTQSDSLLERKNRSVIPNNDENFFHNLKQIYDLEVTTNIAKPGCPVGDLSNFSFLAIRF